MPGTRVYPDERSGPFPTPPTGFEDADGRSIALEELGAEDVDDLVEMYVRFDPADRAQGIPPTGEDRIRQWLEPIVENGVNVVARNGELGAVIGHATLVPDTDDPGAVADLGEIEWELAIFVLQAYQQAGIGTRLLETLLGHASERGIGRVWLTVERWNGPAIALYERVGFEISGAESFEQEMSIRLE
ncbi:GNAT family N-acetyltransferase [Natrononativus amylolyticus]|uniref:GNAT family N-acetyltransferase n=1 Tax=Natrononativus amylolyticus TaxID=2963434 RepID=UPI0020CC414E|nr:GNAT family N-acetyltransferase [Natrononativus amylolyticus]